MRVSLTGATGFIGGHLIERLLVDGHQITALVRNPAAIPSLKARRVGVVSGDVADVDAIDRAIAGSEVVIHMARAKSHGALPREVFAVNVNGTANVARAAARCGVTRVVHCSSSAVYGARCGPVDETSPVRPDSAYARSKIESEAVLLRECGNATAPVIARITGVLGPRCRSWLELFRSAAAGKFPLAGDGSNMHHPVDVSDVVSGLVACAFHPRAAGNTYNLAGPEPVSVAQLRDAMADASAAMRGQSDAAKSRGPSYPRALLTAYYNAGRIADGLAGIRLPYFEIVAFINGNRTFDISRARRDLAYDPQTGVAEGARRTAQWYRSEGLL